MRPILFENAKMPEFRELTVEEAHTVSGGWFDGSTEGDDGGPNDGTFSAQNSLRCNSEGCRTCSRDDDFQDD